MNDWNDERIEAMKVHWAAGLSCGQIALRLGGTTRNAVTGKLHRLGLMGRTGAGRIKSVAINRTKSERARQATRIQFRSIKVIDSEANDNGLCFRLPLPVDLPTDIGRVEFALTDETMCKWIIGDAKPAMCCAAERVPGLPYCPEHCQRAYLAPQITRRRTVVTEREDHGQENLIDA